MKKLTLIPDRDINHLYIDGETPMVSIWDVTGLKWNSKAYYRPVKILRNGKQIGVVWDVKEIKERW